MKILKRTGLKQIQFVFWSDNNSNTRMFRNLDTKKIF